MKIRHHFTVRKTLAAGALFLAPTRRVRSMLIATSLLEIERWIR